MWGEETRESYKLGSQRKEFPREIVRGLDIFVPSCLSVLGTFNGSNAEWR